MPERGIPSFAPKTPDTHRIGDVVYELMLGLCPNGEDVVGLLERILHCQSYRGLRAKTCGVLTGVWPERSLIPVPLGQPAMTTLRKLEK